MSESVSYLGYSAQKCIIHVLRAFRGGNGESFEDHRSQLANEEEPDPTVGEPLLRSMSWTRNESAYRSSIWAGEHEATRCLTTNASDRFCARNGSFSNGKPSNGFGEWIVFDLQVTESARAHSGQLLFQ